MKIDKNVVDMLVMLIVIVGTAIFSIIMASIPILVGLYVAKYLGIV